MAKTALGKVNPLDRFCPVTPKTVLGKIGPPDRFCPTKTDRVICQEPEIVAKQQGSHL